MGGFIALLLVAFFMAVVFWPRVGLIGLAGHFLELSQREQVEHALKHLHHCEFSGLAATRESLAGAVRISRQRAIDLARKLESAALLTTRSGRLELTSAGRREALRVIRIHRLWERYFADESGLDETLWHDAADRREHTTSADETQRLAEQLGHPRYDPHGAPIPTAAGDLPASRGVALSSVEPGERGVVVHLEDEPRATYEQLVAQGITTGATVHVLERTPRKIRLDVDGEEQILAPIVADNVSIERFEPSADDLGASARLSQLLLGRKGRVLGLLSSCRGLQRRRLLDLGLLSGTVVAAELQGFGDDPRAYRIRGALIALREGQSKLVQIEELPEEPIG